MEKTRKECFAYMKANKSLQNKILRETGWQYMNITTPELNIYIDADYNSLKNRIKRLFHK